MNTAHRTASRAKRKYAADPSSIYRLMNKLQPFTPDELVRLELPIRISFENIRTGRATIGDCYDLASAINASIVLAEKIDPVAEAMVLRARDAMVRTLERYTRTDLIGFDGPAIGEVAEAVEFHEQLLRLCTPQQMINAQREVIKRMDERQVM